MKKILIVEDDNSILEILSESLGKEGYEIKKVVSASEALEAAKSFQPHLVLTDNDMPEMSGLDMLRQLRRQKNYVTVIFVSGRTDANFVVEALRAGADDYVRKPFRINELIARIEAALRTNEVHRELLEANLKLQNMVDQDHLTGLFNMRSMYEKIEVEIKRARRFNRHIACVMMDMDHFKSVNDNHDHLFGSFVLKTVGQLIKSNIREVDFAARYGGDEFLVVLTETSPEGAAIFCERIRKAIAAKPITDGKDSIALTVSLGYAIGGADSEDDARTLVRKADQALYKAKELGRNQAVGYKP